MRYRIPKATSQELKVIRADCVNRLISDIRKLDENEGWTVEIKKNIHKRTNEQSKKWHAMVWELSKVIGYTPEELKKWVKKELGYYSVVDGVLGKMYRFESSGDWSPEKMSRAIDQLNIWAIECGHVWRFDQ